MSQEDVLDRLRSLDPNVGFHDDDEAYEAHTRTAHFRDSRPLVEPLIADQECFESNVIARNPVF